MKIWKNKWFRKIVIIAGWLVFWQLVSLWVGNKILLVGPIETVKALFGRLPQPSFWQACGGSLLRILAGFGLGLFGGIGLAMLSYRFKTLKEVLAPAMALLKAVPVASFVVIFLIWWGSEYLAVAISLCVTLPNLYINTLEGLKSTDKKLLEMAKVFKLAKRDVFFYIYRPALKPFWDSAIALAAGMSWKSGVAAEIIGLPAHAIGEQLYLSKIYLDTAGVLAWTVVVIGFSVGFEQLVKWLGNRFFQWKPACKGREKAEGGSASLQILEISKKYYEQPIWETFSAEYHHGESYFFHAPSGSGKTTLFRMIAGLEKPDEGKICTHGQCVGYLFQEDRLCEEYSAIKNVELVTGDAKAAQKALAELLRKEDMHKPCKELSGGMKRRVALVRAVSAGADILLLDEPYTGLDEGNRERVERYITANTKNRIVLMATHVK